MLFNSFQFAIFFIIVYGLYLSLNHKWQNRMLLVASYIFYGTWDWRFLSLIFISTILDYTCGLKIHESTDIKRRKVFLFLSIFGNLSILGFFKYFNFFANSLQGLLDYFGITVQYNFLNVILPVGISFYTFQTMSYTIDIYRKEIEPAGKFFDFALFIAFFPQLVAGPIERAKHLLPQIMSPRKLKPDWFYEGSYLIFWGLFQKIFIADNLAKIVEPVFASSQYKGAEVLLAVYAFTFQIFCDFAGYSNIARGLGRLMGFDIMVNFRMPYFSTNPREFWQRWHISLSGWLRDYLYIPLGGNRRGSIIMYRNLFITMFLGGLWHGAAWTFVLWGCYHGLLLILHRLSLPVLNKITPLKGSLKEKIWYFTRVFFFFHLVCIGWLFFRAQSLDQIFYMFSSLLLNFHFSYDYGQSFIKIIFFISLLLIIQIFKYKKDDMFIVLKLHPLSQVVLYLSIMYSLLLLGATSEEFIYFQF